MFKNVNEMNFTAILTRFGINITVLKKLPQKKIFEQFLKTFPKNQLEL